jgi:hypothetical protein
MYLKNEKPLHQVEKLKPDTPSDNKQEIVETTPVNTEIASINIKDDKTVIKKECDETVIFRSKSNMIFRKSREMNFWE